MTKKNVSNKSFTGVKPAVTPNANFLSIHRRDDESRSALASNEKVQVTASSGFIYMDKPKPLFTQGR
jgi:hypothetical protein